MTAGAATASPDAPAGAPSEDRLRLVSAVLSVLILAVSAWNTILGNGTHQDVSWLLTVAEKMLAGQALYVDVIETNPPFSIYLYVPMAWLGAVTPVSAELWTKIATHVWVLSLGAAALYVARRLRLVSASEAAFLAPVGLYALLLFTPYNFSQREHFAVAGALPMLVLAASRICVGNPPRLRPGWVVLAGFGAAVTMMVKPHYALVFLLPYLLAAWSARTLRVLFAAEVVVAAVFTVAYGAAIWAFHSVYVTGIVPLLVDVYAYRRPLGVLVVLDWEQLVLGAILAALLFSTAPRRAQPLPWAFGAAALGFFCAFLVMGKGWPYHAMPGLVLTFLAIALVGARWALASVASRGEIPLDAVFIALVVAAAMALSQTIQQWSVYKPPASLVARLNAVVENPLVASVSHDIAAGHPWTRSLGGSWIERMCSDWLVMGAGRALLEDLPPADRKRIGATLDETISRKIARWRATPPDIVFLDRFPVESIARLAGHPDLAPLLADYRVVATENGLEIALRSDLVSAWKATASSPGAASD